MPLPIPILTQNLLFSIAKTKWQGKRDLSCSETRGGETCSHQSAWDCELVGGLRCHHHCRHTDLSIYWCADLECNGMDVTVILSLGHDGVGAA